MNIETNRLDIEFNIDAIKQDFAFIRFTKESKKGWIGAHQLDLMLGDDYRADAVLYAYGPYAYAMFRQPVDTYEMISRFRRDKKFSDSAVVEVLPRANVTESNECICEAWLARILINSLAASRSRYEILHYCNLTGRLLAVPGLSGKNRGHIDVFDVDLDRDYLLKVRVKRYRTLHSVENDSRIKKSTRQKIVNENPRYILHEGTGTLRRLLPRDTTPDFKEIFVERGIPGRKAGAHFIDFRSRTAYDESRAGVLHRVLNDIEEHLSGYMSIKLWALDEPHTIELKETLVGKPERFRSRLDGQTIHIVDLVKTEESREMVQSLKEGLHPYMKDPKLLTTGKREKREAFNYRIIHDAAYYERNGKKDEYRPSDSNVLRQNVTIESTEGISDAVVKTLIKEQLIKRDLQEQRLSLFDWSGLNAKEAWTFVAYDKTKENIIFMKIFPDGRFEFQKEDPDTLSQHGEYQEYIEILVGAKEREWRTYLHPEGLVVSETGDKNMIYRTDETTVPDLEGIKSIIREVEDEFPGGMRIGSELALIVEECFTGTPESGSEKVSALIEELDALRHQEISKYTFKKILNSHLKAGSKAATYLRDTLYEKYGVRLHFSKRKESMDTLFSASLNINYFGESESEALYFVGNRRDSVEFHFNNACHLRKVVVIGDSKLRFKEILPTMNVDFVRTGQSTVLPFPFKYIREYAKFGD